MTWSNTNPFLPGSTIRADAMNDKLDGIAANLQEIDQEIATRVIRFPAGFAGENVLAAATVNSFLWINGNGNIDLYSKVSFDSDIATAVTAAQNAAASAAAALTSEQNAKASEINAAESAEIAQQSAVSVAGAAFFAGNWNAATGLPSAPPDGSSIWRATSNGTGDAAGILDGDYIIWDIISGVYRRIPGMPRVADLSTLLSTEVTRIEQKADAALALAAAGL